MCFWWIKDLRVHKDSVGYYELSDIKHDTIVTAVKDSLIRMQLARNDLRAQAYDGASNIPGKKTLMFLSKLQLNTQNRYQPTVKGIH